MPIYSVIQLSQELIRKKSITPDDKGCQKLISNLLVKAGFTIETHRFGDVDNLFAWHGDKAGKSLMFLGHTDVVPVGDESNWQLPPFSGHVDESYLHGRGSADMKAGVAAFTLSVIKYVRENPNHNGKISLMLTSDEEGVAENGVKKMMPHIAINHEIDYCVVGEPSSSEQLGDVVRIGRRGSLHVAITVHGKQGHVAYPQNASNPVFLAAGLIKDLACYKWDNGNEDFPPTSFQISSVKTSSNTSNIIPADLSIQANFRYSTESTEESLNKQLTQLLKQHNLDYSLNWNLSGLPFYSQNHQFRSVVESSIREYCHINPIFNTAGGTSDGRFVAPFGVDVIELGVINKTIHQIDEKVLIDDVKKLEKVYFRLITSLL